jgi:hypothetical protein
MIHMPRRNVTRFFIPLIDVLILLFCIFLLMEFDSAREVDKQVEIVSEQSESLDLIQAELEQRTTELRQFDEDRPKLIELAELRAELERLRKASQRNLQQQAFVRIIDVNGKDGSISFFDDRRPKDPIVPIVGPKSAQALIDRHKEEAKGRQVYYYFLYPRTGRRFPTTAGQEQDYRTWFKGVANSLVKVGS